MSLSAEEQLLLELINRTRLDPSGEAARLARSGDDSLSETLSSGDGTLSDMPDGPLDVVAGNVVLASAAEGHGQWVLDTDRFTHTGEDGSNAGERMRDAGYEFSGTSTWSENLALKGTSGTLDVTAAVHALHANLFESDGHRANMLNGLVREVGVSVDRGDFYGRDSALATQNYARSGAERFLTGVAYDDHDDDEFYSVGEGVAGVRVAGAGSSTATAGAGGYTLSLGDDGNRPWVTITMDSTSYDVRILDRQGNVKIDFIDGDTIASSASLALRGNAQNAVLLGSGDADLKGRAGGNELTGNSGDNLLVGRRGHDALSGGAGNDKLKGGGGRDTLEGGDGNDILRTGRGLDSLDGGAGDDRLFAHGGRDRLDGGQGNDFLKGGRGADNLDGGAGNDRLLGNGGWDRLDGGQGNDFLKGGRGADSFVFAEGGGRDTIRDFGRGNDQLLLDDGLWTGDLTAREVVSQFAHVSDGSVVFEFDHDARLTLSGVSDLHGLAGDIEIF